MRYYDNTMLSTYKKCPRKFYFRHIRHWKPDFTAAPLVFGLSWHDAMDIVWGLAHSDKSDDEILKFAMLQFCQTWEENGMPSWDAMTIDEETRLAPRTPGIASEMIAAYIKERRTFIASTELIAIEKPFAVPLFQEDEDITYIGRMDKVCRHQGRIIIPEHKTTTSYSKANTFRFEFIDQWSPNSQIDGYLHGAHMTYGDEVKAVWIDAALVHKQKHDGFRFIPIDRSMEMLDSWLLDTRNWIGRLSIDETVLEAQRELRPDANIMTPFPKHDGACYDFGKSCSYRDVCRFNPNPETVALPEGFIEDEWRPFEILGIDKLAGGKDESKGQGTVEEIPSDTQQASKVQDS